MDVVGHAVQGSLLFAILAVLARMKRKRLFWILLAVSALFGVLPDLIGAFGNFVLSDNWRLYVSAHRGEIYELLKYIPPYWFHTWIDSLCHEEGSRWWIFGEGLWIEIVLWVINLAAVSWLLLFGLKQGEEETK